MFINVLLNLFSRCPQNRTNAPNTSVQLCPAIPQLFVRGFVAYMPYLHRPDNGSTPQHLDSNRLVWRRRFWPWIVRHMPQTRRYFWDVETFFKHVLGRSLKVLDTILNTNVVNYVFSICGTWIWLPGLPTDSLNIYRTDVRINFRPCP